MENKKAIWYSIIRFSSDKLAGEAVNVGLIMHSLDVFPRVKYLLIDENSPKIRAIAQSQVDYNVYRTLKEILEFYLQESDNLTGTVGEVTIASQDQEQFLDVLSKYFEDKRLYLSKPSFSLSNNPDGLFCSLFETYIGKKYFETNKTVSTKKYMRSVFEKRNLLDRKIKHDFYLAPIDKLSNIKINIDFGFKNGAWNYLQTIPLLTGPAKSTEWFAKTVFMKERLDEQDLKIHLLYRHSDYNAKDDLFEMLDYLISEDSRINALNVSNSRTVDALCSSIEKQAKDLSELEVV